MIPRGEPIHAWFDAHLDLACLAEEGRDMLGPLDPAAGPKPPAAVTLDSLAQGGVRACLATVFTEPTPLGEPVGPVGYRIGDAQGAFEAGRRQIDIYRTWAREGRIGPLRRGEDSAGRERAPLRAGIIVEGADPIGSPDDLGWWIERGVVAVGLTWARSSRYAAGNLHEPGSSGEGLSPIGREMVRRIDAAGLVHDLSHLSQRALDELLSLASGRVMASHSNCRALMSPRTETGMPFAWQRHLPDEAILDVGRRGGVVGVNLFSAFLRPGLFEGGRAGIDDVCTHIERIAGLMGHRRGVGLGSDMDGGFGADRLPEGIDRPADLPRLADALSNRGWSDDEIAGFRWGNWASFWGIGGPAGG